jgi:hypothetical protein
MSADFGRNGWRRWRDGAFAACTVWLVLQNSAILALVAWGRPESALAAGAVAARTAMAFGGQLLILLLAATLGLALAAWLVHAPAAGERAGQEGGS